MIELERIIKECLGEELPFCQAACPLHVDVQGYVKMVRQGNYGEALRVIKRSLPFPAIMGRICTHPCESACRRAQVDDPVAIAHLKRAAADYGVTDEDTAIDSEKDGRVAVIGGGPAGIMAAHDLRKMGYKVTIFEALSYLGGMLVSAIPDFRLPRRLVAEELNILVKLGVTIKLNTMVKEDPGFVQLRREFDAVLVTTGAPLSRKLDIAGSSSEGVLWGLEFLNAMKMDDAYTLKGKVIVIGGGNVAVDAARASLRVGAKEAVIVYRRSKEEMPAIPEEIRQAIEEGVLLETFWAPRQILSHENKVTGVEFVHSATVPGDRRQTEPVLDQTVTKVVNGDTVIVAIGQQTDATWLDAMELSGIRGGLIPADPLTRETVNPGVFACGDAVTGPKSVIDAFAAGRSAALSIDRYLRGEDLTHGREAEMVRESRLVVPIEGVEKKSRCAMPLLEVNERFKDVKGEVELGYSTVAAQDEASRCLECECKSCAKGCEFLKSLNETPKTMAQKLKEGAFRDDKRLVYRCNVCDLCKRNCTNELSVGEMLMEIRRAMVEEGLGPLPQHQFVKRDQDFSTSEKFTLVYPDPEAHACKAVFFPGCGLCSYSPELVVETYEHLRQKLPDTGLILGCCGGPTRFLGDEARFRVILDQLIGNVRATQASELIVACPDCFHTLRHNAPGLRLRPLPAVLLEHFSPALSIGEGRTVSIHDSCKARWEREWHDSVRAVIAKLGFHIEEIAYSRDMTRCCGLGGMVPYADPDLASTITRKRADEFSHDIVTYCASCREALAAYKPALHLLDLLFNAQWTEAKGQPPKIGKLRRENQARAKQLICERYHIS
jgi:NADPH-dependent glutamate synthase beta subunit-like oxidoreductase